jgi:hypothetical protein
VDDELEVHGMRALPVRKRGRARRRAVSMQTRQIRHGHPAPVTAPSTPRTRHVACGEKVDGEKVGGGARVGDWGGG